MTDLETHTPKPTPPREGDASYHFSEAITFMRIGMNGFWEAPRYGEEAERQRALTAIRMQQAQVHATLFAALYKGEGEGE